MRGLTATIAGDQRHGRPRDSLDAPARGRPRRAYAAPGSFEAGERRHGIKVLQCGKSSTA